jgi:DNA-binding SARP family transcriptional activator
MSGLAISLLGAFRVERDGKPAIGFHSDTARALLAYLAVHAGVSCPRQTLAGLLWPEQPDAEALRNLRVALSRLRKAIGDRPRLGDCPRSGDREAEPPYLTITRRTLQFNRDSDYWLDIQAFTDALAEVQAHRHRRSAPGCRRRCPTARPGAGSVGYGVE